MQKQRVFIAGSSLAPPSVETQWLDQRAPAQLWQGF